MMRIRQGTAWWVGLLKLRGELMALTGLVLMGVSLTVRATPPLDEQLTPLAGGQIEEFKLHDHLADGTHVKFSSDSALDALFVQIIHPPRSYSGWHEHAGPVIGVVNTGELTFYHADDPTCSPTLYMAGQMFIESSGKGHFAINEGSTTTEVVVLLFAPSGVFPCIDISSPGNCPF